MQRRQIPVRRIGAGTASNDQDWIVVEEPLQICVRFPPQVTEAESLVVTMRTPGHDADLALGFLFTEGLIREAIPVCRGGPAERPEDNVLCLDLAPEQHERFLERRRNFYASSSCGICGKSSMQALQSRAGDPIESSGFAIAADSLRTLPEEMAKRQIVFAATGGLHAAALFDAGGRITDVREDIGRHNAVDKLIGAALRDGRLPFANHGLLVSGRASFEIVEKARMAGCPLLVAVGAPSSLAIDAAWESNMTLAGFLRDGRFNIYTVPARVIARQAARDS